MYFRVRRFMEHYIPDQMWTWFKHRRFERIVKNSLKDVRPEIAIIKSLLCKNSMALDIGSNIGVYSAFMAQNCKKVYAIEPIYETYNGLLYVINKLKCNNIIPIHSAVSNKNGFVNMVIPVNVHGVKNFYRSHISETDRSQPNGVREVMSITLDDYFFSNARNISFVKCDTEGHDLRCLQGAAKILNAGFSAWLVEINDRSDDKDSNLMKIFSFFQNAGYRPWIIRNNMLQLRKNDEYDTNYFFLKDKHSQRLKQEGLC